MLRGHRILNSFQLRRIKLDDLAAFGTDHVIVMLMFVVMFVMRATVAETHLTRQTSFRQQAQGAIHSRLPDCRILLPHQSIKILTLHVPLSFQEYFEDQITLGRALQSLFLDVPEKDFLFFGHEFRELCVSKYVHILTSGANYSRIRSMDR